MNKNKKIDTEIDIEINHSNLIAKLVLPEEFLISFDVSKVEQDKKEIKISLTEKDDLIPQDLNKITGGDNSKVVLDGYCSAIELMDFPIRDKSTFITLRKRRWKLSKDAGKINLYRDKSFTNEYHLNFPGMKTTKKFGIFLKELTRDELNELFNSFPIYKSIFKEDI